IESNVQVFEGHLSGTDIVIDSFAPGYEDLGSSIGDIIVIKPATSWSDELADILGVSHNSDGTLKGDKIYPVGSIYINAEDDTNPATLLGFGTWEAFGSGRVPVGIDSEDEDFNTAGKTGGSKEMQEHDHRVDSAVIGGGSNTAIGRTGDGGVVSGHSVGITTNAGTGDSGNLQ